MNTLSYKTVSANKNTVNKEWVLVDADGQTLGRLASKVAMLIRGKYKPSFTPHVDCGDNVVVIKEEKINLILFMILTTYYVEEIYLNIMIPSREKRLFIIQ